MTGKAYYISTIAEWQRHASRFSNSHWVVLPKGSSEATARVPTGDSEKADQPILILVEADEGAHLALEDDPAFEALPHPLAQKAISEKARRALAGLDVSSGATTFDVTEVLARFHPLLRHRVF
jgi:hypothetical protein